MLHNPAKIDRDSPFETPNLAVSQKFPEFPRSLLRPSLVKGMPIVDAAWALNFRPLGGSEACVERQIKGSCLGELCRFAMSTAQGLNIQNRFIS
jgi:hypothetical protein